jgi:hypothetical protein
MILLLGVKNCFAFVACSGKLAFLEMVMQLKNVKLTRIFALGVIWCLERYLAAVSLFYFRNDFSILLGDFSKLKLFGIA